MILKFPADLPLQASGSPTRLAALELPARWNAPHLASSFQLLVARYTDETEFSLSILGPGQAEPGEIAVTINEDASVGEFLAATRIEAVQIGVDCVALKTQTNSPPLLLYAPDRFAPATIQSLAKHLCNIADGLDDRHAVSVSKIEMLTPDEIHCFTRTWNATERNRNLEDTLVRLFERQVDATPDRCAVIFGDRMITYREFNAQVNRLARDLVASGVGTETIVGVFFDRSMEMLLAIYAVVKAGGAYLPIETTLPRDRIAAILADAKPILVLTRSEARDKLPTEVSCVKVIHGGQFEKEASPGDGANLDRGPAPDSLAYCIFTSGSTGRPKGVMISHRSICNRLSWMQEQYNLRPDDRVLQKTPYGFDVSVWELFWPLETGATLVILEPERHRSARELVESIVQHRITHLHFVPSMLQAFLEDPKAPVWGTSIKNVFCSGEELPLSVQNRFFDLFGVHVGLHNLYGPTEAAVDITHWTCRPEEAARGFIPIGSPVANSQVYILDRRQRLLPRVSTGELWLGGIQLARGYLHRPDLTAERFAMITVAAGVPAIRGYKTGDLARWTPDGQIAYLGRNDFQVKIAGQRIELGEIEATLNAHPSVSSSIVALVQAPSGAKQLAAYVKPSTQYSADTNQPTAALREHLRAKLPAHMLPQHWIWMPAFPLSGNGKLDRGQLPNPYRAYKTLKGGARS